jgi:hypothetical protein
MKRDYRKEYDEYHAKPEQKKRRASRNAARNKLAKTGRVRKGDGKEVDHKDMNPRNNRRSNLKVVPKVVNRKKQPKRNVRKA